MDKKIISKRIIVRGGKVHNVGYRLHILQKAEALLIPNIGIWNTYEEGKEAVEVLVGGEEKKVDKFVQFIKTSFPEKAKLEGTPTIDDYEEDIPTIEAFSRSFSTSQLAKIANAGITMLEKQDKTLEKQDIMIQKIDAVGSKVDAVGSKVDAVGKKVEDVGQKVDAVGSKVDSLKDATHNDFNRMDAKYDKISEKMDSINKSLKKIGDALV